MEDLGHPLERLKRFWASQGVACTPPASHGELEAFERRYGVTIPDDLRQYFLTINGMLATPEESPWDDEEIRFYPLSEVMPDEGPIAGGKSWFTFADYMINSHEYVVELGPAGRSSGIVYAVAGPAVRLADSFNKFLARYLARDKAVLNPWG